MLRNILNIEMNLYIYLQFSCIKRAFYVVHDHDNIFDVKWFNAVNILLNTGH